MEKTFAIILAAGKGTRMHTDLPKCACPFCGKAMVEYIVDECRKSEIADVIVVVGYKKEGIIDVLKDRVKYANQEEQLGTGHAVLCCEELLKDQSGLCLIFPGDMPLIDEKIIRGLIETHKKEKNDLTVVTTIMDDPTGYGRIYRENGYIKKIVEHKDATEEQKQIREINSALYCVDLKMLFEALHHIKNHNASKEYYLTDIVEIFGNEHKKVDSYLVENHDKLVGINDLEALRKAEELYFKVSGSNQ